MDTLTTLATLWPFAPYLLAIGLVARGRVARDRGPLPSKLYLRDRGRMLQGLCAGIAEYLGVSVWLVRAIALCVAVTSPHGFAAYVLMSLAFEWHPADTKDWLRTRLRSRLDRVTATRA
jgi:phage shock protein PspC (stress-responsive transcriptional regulator)